MSKVKVSAWGHLKLVESGADPILAKGPNGMYKTGMEGPPWMLLECLCGYRFRVYDRDFPGRSAMRDCQREECSARHLPDIRPRGRPQTGGVVNGERGHVYGMYLKPALIAQIKAYARENSLSNSGATTVLLISGLSAQAALKEAAARKKSAVGIAVQSGRAAIE